MTSIIDDFDAIRARLAELRGEKRSGGALEFNADELIIVSDVSVPLSSLRIEAELDADAYKRGAEEVAAANRRIEGCSAEFEAGLAQLEERWGKAGLLDRLCDQAEAASEKFNQGLRTIYEALKANAITSRRADELQRRLALRYGDILSQPGDARLHRGFLVTQALIELGLGTAK
jgi:uncharacterized protein YukE